MEKNDLWMGKLKEKLSDYSESAPVSGWERLEKELVRPPVEKRIIPFLNNKWAMSIAAAVLLAAVSSVSFYFLNSPVADKIRNTQPPMAVVTPDTLSESDKPDPKGKAIEQVFRPNKQNQLAKVDIKEKETGIEDIRQAKFGLKEKHSNQVRLEESKGKGVGRIDTEENISMVDRKEEFEEDDRVDKRENRVGEENKNSHADKQKEASGKKQYFPLADNRLYLQKGKSSKRGIWSMGFSVGNSGGAAVGETGLGVSAYNMSRVSMLAISNNLMEIPEGQTLVFEEGIPYLRQANNVINMEHHQPISFGVSVRKELSRGFSLETGLTYTLLASDVRLSGDEHNIEQKLHYVGIPLRANWSFFSRKLFTLYVSGGGMVEKCVYGKLGTEKETVKPLQFSVSSAVGAQLNLSRRIGVYAEPGIAYFFDDGSDIQTIRKESPFNFNIQAGIRLVY